jgi:hypothetical protein
MEGKLIRKVHTALNTFYHDLTKCEVKAVWLTYLTYSVLLKTVFTIIVLSGLLTWGVWWGFGIFDSTAPTEPAAQESVE